jgi:hypothetical protein
MADPAARQLSALCGLAAATLCLLACTQAPATMAGVATLADASVAAIDVGPARHLTRISLIDQTRWTQVGSAEDPFMDRPADVRCPESAAAAEVLSEQPAFGVDTGMCNYLTVQQLTRDYVAAGETIDVRLWHFELAAPNPGEAHAAVDVGRVRALDQRVQIPAPGGLIKASLVADHALPAGTPVYFHLHNHGANSWALIEITTGPAP